MTKKDWENLREKLADIEHQRWSDWQSWCHKVLRENIDELGLEGILERWDRQIATDYKDLTEKEKDSDREQVDRYLPIIKQNFIPKSDYQRLKAENEHLKSKLEAFQEAYRTKAKAQRTSNYDDPQFIK